METESKVSTGQSKGVPDLILIDELCLFVSLLTFLAVLGWATWEIRLAKPLAFTMFIGLMAAGLLVAIAAFLSRRASNAFAVSLKRVPESIYLSTLIGEPIKHSRPIKDEHFILV